MNSLQSFSAPRGWRAGVWRGCPKARNRITTTAATYGTAQGQELNYKPRPPARRDAMNRVSTMPDFNINQKERNCFLKHPPQRTRHPGNAHTKTNCRPGTLTALSGIYQLRHVTMCAAHLPNAAPDFAETASEACSGIAAIPAWQIPDNAA